MPESFCKDQILPPKILCHQKLSLQNSQCEDLSFIKKDHSTEEPALILMDLIQNDYTNLVYH